MKFLKEAYTSYGVYRIVSPNGSCYIGMTTRNFAERWNRHITDFKANKSRCQGLARAFTKYGIDSMSFEIIKEMSGCSETEILKAERDLWHYYKAKGINVYNGEPSGNGSVIHTAETRKKISLAGKKNDGLTRDRHGRRLYKKICQNPKCKQEYLGKKVSKYCSVRCRSRKVRDYVDVDKILQAHNNGFSLRKIGKDNDINYETVRQIIKENKK